MAMEVMSGACGSSENSAVQARPASSLQCTVADAAVEVTVTGPGRTPERSNGTARAAASAETASSRADFMTVAFTGRNCTARKPTEGGCRSAGNLKKAVAKRKNATSYCRVSLRILFLILYGGLALEAQVSVLTANYGVERTNANLQETILSPK